MNLKTSESKEMLFEGKIQESLSNLLKIPHGDVVLQKNLAKYCDFNESLAYKSHLEQVFTTMRDLNYFGIEDKSVGCSEHGGVSLSRALEEIIRDFVEFGKEKNFQYVELGPEPIKTTFILKNFFNSGIRLQSYVGVDINPESKKLMEEAIKRQFPELWVDYLTVSFEKLQSADIQKTGISSLFTMLGFEEGNEDPSEMAAFLNKITKRGDLLLSEMQLLSQLDMSPIFSFYKGELMKKFSKLHFQRVFGNIESEYGVFLVPIFWNGEKIFVAVTTELILGISELNGKFFVTNYCIKYQANEFRDFREKSGDFRVISQRTTSDGSLAFQLSERI